jgi:hypothetical protein
MATTHTNRLQSGAIQPVKSVEQVAIGTGLKPIEPNDLSEVMTFAQVAVRGGMFGLRSIEEAASRILYGRELGMSAFMSIMSIDVIKGRPGLKAVSIASLIQKSPRFNFRKEKWTDTECVIRFFENGEDVGESSFTIADAKRAGLVTKDSNWEKYPKSMLFWRALTQGARAYCPSVFHGPIESVEELLDQTGQVIDVQIIEPEPPTEVKPEAVVEQPAKPAKAAKKAKPEPTPEPQPAAEPDAPFDDAPQTETVAEKTQKLDEWAARVAKRFDDKGQASFAMPGAVVEEMYNRFLELAFVPPGAKSYRERTQAIASIEATWAQILDNLKAFAADLAAELDAPPQAEADEPGSDG